LREHIFQCRQVLAESVWYISKINHRCF